MPLESRGSPPSQRLVLTAPQDVRAPLVVEAVGSPVEFLIASREFLEAGRVGDAHWATTAVYVLVGGPEIPLGPGDPVAAYDRLLDREASEEPPGEPGIDESLDANQHTEHWRARFYTGMTRDALRRIAEHAAKPWWSRALLCRQSPPWPYEIGDIGYLEGELHALLDGAYWLKREGRASCEEAIMPNRAENLETGHLPPIAAAIRLLGVPLDTEEQVKEMIDRVASGGADA